MEVSGDGVARRGRVFLARVVLVRVCGEVTPRAATDNETALGFGNVLSLSDGHSFFWVPLVQVMMCLFFALRFALDVSHGGLGDRGWARQGWELVGL